MEPNKLRRSRISFLHNYLLSLLLFAFTLFLFSLGLDVQIQNIGATICYMLIGILISEPEVERSYRYYFIDEKSVNMVEGILSKKKTSIPFNQIAGVTVMKTVLGRLLKFGDIEIQGVKDKLVLKGMGNPDKLFAQIQEKIEYVKKKGK